MGFSLYCDGSRKKRKEAFFTSINMKSPSFRREMNCTWWINYTNAKIYLFFKTCLYKQSTAGTAGRVLGKKPIALETDIPENMFRLGWLGRIIGSHVF